MKFALPLFALFAATNANIISESIINDKLETQCAPDLIDQNKECLFIDAKQSLESLKALCTSYKSDKCQKFYTEYFEKVFTCYNGTSEESAALARLNLEMDQKRMEYICTTDNNELCPLAKSMSEAIDYDQFINDSCKSKVCTDAAYNLLELNLGKEGLSDYKDVVIDKPFNVMDAIEHTDSDFYGMTYLKSDYCKAQQGKETKETKETKPAKQNAQSSDATTMKYSMMLTIISLLYALF